MKRISQLDLQGIRLWLRRSYRGLRVSSSLKTGMIMESSSPVSEAVSIGDEVDGAGPTFSEVVTSVTSESLDQRTPCSI